VIRRGLVLCLGAAVLAGIVVLVAEGAHGAWITVAILAPVGAVAILAAQRIRHPASLRAQFAFTGALAVGQLVVIVALTDAFMIVDPNDALVVGVIALYCGVVAVWVGRLLARRVSDRLAEEERARRGLIAAVSHDLRTPITSLQLLVEAVDDEVVSEEARKEYLARLSTHVRALSALIDDLFELSRLESGDIRWSMEQVPIEELVSETVAAMAPAAEAKHVAVRADLNGALSPATGNPEQIQRVLFNLIQNAIRHTPADGSVVVRAERLGEAVEIEVADTGDGIAADDRPRVFDAFFQGGTRAPRSNDGAGLGLAIARAIVEAHGGRIYAGASTAGGARVAFELPGYDRRRAPGVRETAAQRA
jgi:signal transduction histidine kinase